MNQFITFEPAIEITNRRLITLGDRIDDCGGSDDYLPIIRKIARTKHPEAIEILVALLDSAGPIGTAAVGALVGFGEAAVPALERARDTSLDGDAMCQARMALARIARESAACDSPPMRRAA